MGEYWASQLLIVRGHLAGEDVERDKAVLTGAAAYIRNLLPADDNVVKLEPQATLGEVPVSKTGGAGSTPDVCADGVTEG